MERGLEALVSLQEQSHDEPRDSARFLLDEPAEHARRDEPRVGAPRDGLRPHGESARVEARPDDPDGGNSLFQPSRTLSIRKPDPTSSSAGARARVNPTTANTARRSATSLARLGQLGTGQDQAVELEQGIPDRGGQFIPFGPRVRAGPVSRAGRGSRRLSHARVRFFTGFVPSSLLGAWIGFSR